MICKTTSNILSKLSWQEKKALFYSTQLIGTESLIQYYRITDNHVMRNKHLRGLFDHTPLVAIIR
jgi:hypothetical protein